MSANNVKLIFFKSWYLISCVCRLSVQELRNTSPLSAEENPRFSAPQKEDAFVEWRARELRFDGFYRPLTGSSKNKFTLFEIPARAGGPTPQVCSEMKAKAEFKARREAPQLPSLISYPILHLVISIFHFWTQLDLNMGYFKSSTVRFPDIVDTLTEIAKCLWFGSFYTKAFIGILNHNCTGNL